MISALALVELADVVTAFEPYQIIARAEKILYLITLKQTTSVNLGGVGDGDHASHMRCGILMQEYHLISQELTMR